MRKLRPLSSVPVNKNQIIVGIGLGLSALFPLYADAGCSQGDMTGTWYTYSSSDDSAGGFYPHTNRCKVKLNSSGNIVPSGVYFYVVEAGNFKASHKMLMIK